MPRNILPDDIHPSPHGTVALARPPAPICRQLIELAIIFLAVGAIAGAAALPFRFESQSLWYRLGHSKELLRGGQVLGSLCALLILLQALLVCRLRLLDQILGLPTILRLHRRNGLIIVTLALLHPMLIFIPEQLQAMPLARRYWPQYLGLALLLTLTLQCVMAGWRTVLGLDFEHWRRGHGLAFLAVLVLLALHLGNVNEVFAAGPPQKILYAGLALTLCALAWSKLRPLLAPNAKFTVVAATPLAGDIVRLDLHPSHGQRFAFLPGQFLFLTCQTPDLPREEHPFTIASSPTHRQGMTLLIRACGDWTRRLAAGLAPGAVVTVDGPYGRFCHQLEGPAAGIVMVAGGIGITPMLSMLQAMADLGEDHRTTLIWSNRQALDSSLVELLTSLGRRLPRLTVVHHSTSQTDNGLPTRRLNEASLRHHLGGCSRQATIYLCGPPAMMADIHRLLLRLGFSRRRIHTEDFAL